MPRKPILTAASIVIGSTGVAQAHVSDDEIFYATADEDPLIELAPDPIHLELDRAPFGSEEDVGVEYAQTYFGGSGNDGIIQGPVKTPKLQDGGQIQQPRLKKPKLQTQPSVQGVDQKPRKRKLRKKRNRN